MARVKCNVSTCKYNNNNGCCSENLMVNAIRPGCTSKEGTYCDGYERRDDSEIRTSTDRRSFWE
jgi:hypothetical protein